MTANSDGWYSYDVSIGTDLGVYRTEVCCNASGEYLCIDKTFEVSDGAAEIAQETADAVWDSSKRGRIADEVWDDSKRTTFIGEIWDYSSDSLGSFATKITSIFNNSNQLTGNTSSSTTTSQTFNYLTTTNTTDAGGSVDSIPDLSAQIAQNRTLIQELLNKPIMQNFIEEQETVDLSEKITQTKAASDSIYSQTQSIKAKLTNLMLKWPTLTTSKIETELESIIGLLGTTADTSQNSSLMGSLNVLLQGWGDNPIIKDIQSNANSTITSVSVIQNILRSSGTVGFEFQDSLIESIDVIKLLEDSIGDASDSLGATTLFGFLRKLESSNDNFGSISSEIDDLLKNYDQYSISQINQKVAQFSQTILANNQITGAERLLDDPVNPDSPHPKYTLYGLKAIIGANNQKLGSLSGNPVSDLWIQDQDKSMFFRGYVLNPSSQQKTAQVKFALPAEILKEHLLNNTDNLSVEYDPPEDAFMVTASYTLNPGELVTFYVETQNIWGLTDETLDNYLKQAEGLVDSLRKSSLYGQAASIKSDIEVTLDKIRVKIGGITSPEDRIRIVREAQLDLLSVDEKMNTLKELVSETTSAKSIVGAVGGIQTVAVWGLILIFVAGFVFLVIFMRRMQPAAAGVGIRRTVVAKPVTAHNPIRVRMPRKPIRSTDFKPSINTKAPYGRLAFTGILTIALATVVVGIISKNSRKVAPAPTQAPNQPTAQSQGIIIKNTQKDEAAEQNPDEKLAESNVTEAVEKDPVLGTTSAEMIVEITNDPVNILTSPSSTAGKVMSISSTQTVYIFGVEKDPVSGTSFSRVGFSEDDDKKDWWIETSLLSSPSL
ncbi:hypothetical protein ACFL1M_04595 [Patescibacteria group bacterium]